MILATACYRSRRSTRHNLGASRSSKSCLSKTSSRALVFSAVRASIDAARTRRAGAPDDWAEDVASRLGDERRAALRPVINATGVVLHTNLGRAPLPAAAIDAMVAVATRLLQPRVRSVDRQPRAAAPTTAAPGSDTSPARRTHWW